MTKILQINVTTGELEENSTPDPAIGFALENAATDPSPSPASGRLFLNTTLNAIRARINGAWEQLVTNLTAFAGDVTGTIGSTVVEKINGVAITNTPAGAGVVLTATGTAAAQWQNPTGGGGSSVYAGARVRGASPTSVTGGVNTPISFASAMYDSSTFYSSGTPTRLTIPTGGGGKYIAAFSVVIQPASGGNRLAFVQRTRSGVTTLEFTDFSGDNNNQGVGLQGCQILDLVDGDYLEVFIQSNGANVTIETNFDFGPYFSIAKIG